jgi:hypothetical protein
MRAVARASGRPGRLESYAQPLYDARRLVEPYHQRAFERRTLRGLS